MESDGSDRLGPHTRVESVGGDQALAYDNSVGRHMYGAKVVVKALIKPLRRAAAPKCRIDGDTEQFMPRQDMCVSACVAAPQDFEDAPDLARLNESWSKRQAQAWPIAQHLAIDRPHTAPACDKAGDAGTIFFDNQNRSVAEVDCPIEYSQEARSEA